MPNGEGSWLKVVASEVLVALMGACIGGLLVGYNDRASFTASLAVLTIRVDKLEEFSRTVERIEAGQDKLLQELDRNQRKVMLDLKLQREQ